MPLTAKTVAMATANAPVRADATDDFGAFVPDAVTNEVVELLAGATEAVGGEVSGGGSTVISGETTTGDSVVVVSSGGAVVGVAGWVVVVVVGSVSGGTWA
jgi:hypothetical protein